jgi:hypothetical protein
MTLTLLKKFTLSTKKFTKTILILLFVVSSCLSVSGQKYHLTFTHVTLADALVKVSEHYNCKFAFDAKTLSTIDIKKEVKGNTLEELVADLLKDTGFEYEYKHDRFLIVASVEKPTHPEKVTCEFTGSVTDNETGEQLPFASLFVQNQNISTVASNTGTFGIQNITANPIHIVIHFIGYATLDTLIYWSQAKISCNFRLSQKPHQIESIVIKQPSIEMVNLRNDVDFATTINPSKLIDLPMLAESDVFRALQLLPGISYNESSSELNIRGGTSDQNLILFDGQTLYNLSHYYGVVSSLNPNIIKDIQVYKGGYDSRYGERVSGIVDVTAKSGNQQKPSVYGDVNLISGNVTAEIPVTRKLTLVGAVRRSYSDIYATSFSDGLFSKAANTFKADSSGIVHNTRPTFYFFDYNAKATYRPTDNETYSISVYGGNDYYKNQYSGSTRNMVVNTLDKNTWNNYGISASWLKQWNSSYYSNLQIGSSGYTNNSNNTTDLKRLNDMHDPGAPSNLSDTFTSYNRNKLTDISASFRNILSINDKNQLSFGVIARRNTIFYHKDADKIYVYDSINQKSWFSTLYIQDKIQIIDNLTLKPGFRLNYYDANRQWYYEPRLSANYRFSPKFSMRIATGKYRQFISQVQSVQETGYTKNFWVMAQDTLHPVLNAFHYIIGSTLEAGNFLLDAEAYLKTYSGLQEYLYISPYLRDSDFGNYFPPRQPTSKNLKEPSIYATGKGMSYGIDFFVRYKYQNYTSWISYTLGKSANHFALINHNNEIPALTDQRHQLSYTNMISLGKWNIGSTSLFATGRPYVDLTQNKQNMPIDRVYKRLPNYWRTDLSANYSFSLYTLRLKAGVTIINCFNNKNYFDINTKKFDFDNTSFSETNLIQTQKLSFNFFLHFAL